MTLLFGGHLQVKPMEDLIQTNFFCIHQQALCRTCDVYRQLSAESLYHERFWYMPLIDRFSDSPVAEVFKRIAIRLMQK